jgi:hypothetical protein
MDDDETLGSWRNWIAEDTRSSRIAMMRGGSNEALTASPSRLNEFALCDLDWRRVGDDDGWRTLKPADGLG